MFVASAGVSRYRAGLALILALKLFIHVSASPSGDGMYESDMIVRSHFCPRRDATFVTRCESAGSNGALRKMNEDFRPRRSCASRRKPSDPRELPSRGHL